MTERPRTKQFEPEDLRGIGPPIMPEHVGMRIDSYLASNFPFKSRQKWQRLLHAGEVLIDMHKSVGPAYKLRPGEKVCYYYPFEAEPNVSNDVKVTWEEKGILVASKPSGLPMHEGGAFRHNTFARVLKEVAGSEWAAVHRLDRETSGAVLCGATPEIRKILSDQFEARKMSKAYLAIAFSTPLNDEWDVDAPIGDNPQSKIRIKRWVTEDGGISAQTKFRLVDKISSKYSLLRAYPLTGRTNQIRIHAAYCKLPLIGDKLYHEDDNIFIEFQEKGELSSDSLKRVIHPRVCLHAEQITFLHPITKQYNTVTVEIADDMKKLWSKLKNQEMV